MAQRTIHLAMAKLISQKIKIKNMKRFEFGHILPDAVSDRENRDKSHYIEKGRFVTYDFERFGREYRSKILEDDLYLGYYMHLIEDVFYRKVLYTYHDMGDIGKFPERVKILHNDYYLLNEYIINKFQLKNDIEIPSEFEKEQINNIADFSGIKDYITELDNDFHDAANGKTVYFTESMLDEYMENYLNPCIEEIKALRNGETYLGVRDYKWEA